MGVGVRLGRGGGAGHASGTEAAVLLVLLEPMDGVGPLGAIGAEAEEFHGGLNGGGHVNIAPKHTRIYIIA